MVKRARNDAEDESVTRKRARSEDSDKLSALSDELLLRTLSYLPIADLALCERYAPTHFSSSDIDLRRLCQHINALATDSQLWKALYYDRFVRPRASRIPGIKDAGPNPKRLFYASRNSRWLQDDYLRNNVKATDWKQQYKLRHNWSRGSARVSETEIAEQSSVPGLLVCLHGNQVITASSDNGLRAWTFKPKRALIATLSLEGSIPSSLAVNTSSTADEAVDVSVGFTDGSFSIHTLCIRRKLFTLRFVHRPPSNTTTDNAEGAGELRRNSIPAMAFAMPYLLTMDHEPTLSLYHFDNIVKGEDDAKWDPPLLLSSLKSHTAHFPLSLTIRTSKTCIFASIAYTTSAWKSSWSVGLQELRLSFQGAILESRTACARTSSGSGLQLLPDLDRIESIITGGRLGEASSVPSSARPTSLSYTHPYLLTSHPDNTLTLYMVSSTIDELHVGPGSRLWGHTSSISGAHIGERGRAVSVSTVGDELRIWDLERGLSSQHPWRRAYSRTSSVAVRSELQKWGGPQQLSSVYDFPDETTIAPGWITFDDEQVVLLRGKLHGPQKLVTYDFT